MSVDFGVQEESAITGKLIAEAYGVKRPIVVNGVTFISAGEFARIAGVTKGYVNILTYKGNSIRKLTTVRRDDRGSIDVYVAELMLFPWPKKGKEKRVEYLAPDGGRYDSPTSMAQMKTFISNRKATA